MMRSKRLGNRYLAALVMALGAAHLVVGTLGPARQSPNFFLLIPLPAIIAIFVGWQAWTTEDTKSAGYSAAGLVILLVALAFSHLASA